MQYNDVMPAFFGYKNCNKNKFHVQFLLNVNYNSVQIISKVMVRLWFMASKFTKILAANVSQPNLTPILGIFSLVDQITVLQGLPPYQEVRRVLEPR